MRRIREQRSHFSAGILFYYFFFSFWARIQQFLSTSKALISYQISQGQSKTELRSGYEINNVQHIFKKNRRPDYCKNKQIFCSCFEVIRVLWNLENLAFMPHVLNSLQFATMSALLFSTPLTDFMSNNSAVPAPTSEIDILPATSSSNIRWAATWQWSKGHYNCA